MSDTISFDSVVCVCGHSKGLHGTHVTYCYECVCTRFRLYHQCVPETDGLGHLSCITCRKSFDKP